MNLYLISIQCNPFVQIFNRVCAIIVIQAKLPRLYFFNKILWIWSSISFIITRCNNLQAHPFMKEEAFMVLHNSRQSLTLYFIDKIFRAAFQKGYHLRHCNTYLH